MADSTEGKIKYQSYEPPGPVGAAFIESKGPVDIIMGPAGSGKTVASCYKCLYLASTWFPICKDGWVRMKIVCVRDTYRNLARTALESWHDMFPVEHPFTEKYTGGLDRPVKHILHFWSKRDGIKELIPVELVMDFNAIGDQNLETFCRGYEVSAFWANEVDTMHERMMGLMYSRTGRFPRVEDVAEAEMRRILPPYLEKIKGLGIELTDDDKTSNTLPKLGFADCNPPDLSNFVCQITGLDGPEKKNKMYNLFRQPSGLAKNAENRKGKSRLSYLFEEQTIPIKEDIRRFVYGMPGYVRSGVPVYDNLFNLDTHRSALPLDGVKELPLSIGMDAGGSPAAVIGQFMPNGQRRVLREICSEPGTGPTRFAEMVAEILARDFRDFRVNEVFADPASFYGADKINGEMSWVAIVARVLNMNIFPTDSNEPAVRQEAVRWYLTGMIDAHTPRYLVDPRCARLIGGFMSHYKLTKQASEGSTDVLVVEKNKYSHIHDAEQYACLGHKGTQGVIDEQGFAGRKKGRVRGFVGKANFNIFGP